MFINYIIVAYLLVVILYIQLLYYTFCMIHCYITLLYSYEIVTNL